MQPPVRMARGTQRLDAPLRRTAVSHRRRHVQAMAGARGCKRRTRTADQRPVLVLRSLPLLAQVLRSCGLLLVGCLLVLGCSATSPNVGTSTHMSDVDALLQVRANFTNSGVLDWNVLTDPCGNAYCAFGRRHNVYVPHAGNSSRRCNWEGIECEAWRVVNLNLSCPDVGWGGCATRLTGQLSDAFGKMMFLKRIDLSNNMLTGPLPQSIDRLHNLRRLTLARNMLKGTLPPSWGHCSMLETLDLSYNQLSGQLPAAWASMVAIKQLNLTGNLLDGPLPSAFIALQHATELMLADNMFSGSLPSSWNNLLSLTSLDVSGNCALCGYPPTFNNDVAVNTNGTGLGMPCEQVLCQRERVFPLATLLPGVILGSVLCMLLAVTLACLCLLRCRLRQRRRLLAAGGAATAGDDARGGAEAAGSAGAAADAQRVGKWRDYAKLVLQPDWSVAFGVIEDGAERDVEAGARDSKPAASPAPAPEQGPGRSDGGGSEPCQRSSPGAARGQHTTAASAPPTVPPLALELALERAAPPPPGAASPFQGGSINVRSDSGRASPGSRSAQRAPLISLLRLGSWASPNLFWAAASDSARSLEPELAGCSTCHGGGGGGGVGRSPVVVLQAGSDSGGSEANAAATGQAGAVAMGEAGAAAPREPAAAAAGEAAAAATGEAGAAALADAAIAASREAGAAATGEAGAAAPREAGAAATGEAGAVAPREAAAAATGEAAAAAPREAAAAATGEAGAVVWGGAGAAPRRAAMVQTLNPKP